MVCLITLPEQDHNGLHKGEKLDMYIGERSIDSHNILLENQFIIWKSNTFEGAGKNGEVTLPHYYFKNKIVTKRE